MNPALQSNNAASELPCVRIFGAVQGSEIIELIERTTGEPCPCRQGRQCPLLPAPRAMLEVISTTRAS